MNKKEKQMEEDRLNRKVNLLADENSRRFFLYDGVNKKPFKWIDKEEWDFLDKQLPSRYIAGSDPINENKSEHKVQIIPLQEFIGPGYNHLINNKMEEESKYYIPEIEEFRVGFKYEINYSLMNSTLAIPDPNGYQWHKKTITPISDLHLIETEIGTKQIKVKYLDKEDIESLGFKMNEEFKSEFKNNDLDIRILYCKEDHTLSIIDSQIRRCSNLVIKNISELKVLLKRLNIGNN